MALKQISLVILESRNGRDGWMPVKPEDVPAWVKDPLNVDRLVKGESCMKCDEGPKGSNWYRGMPMDDFRRWQKAENKRIRKMQRNATVH